jgi:Holliday junction DNA helicase RuvA
MLAFIEGKLVVRQPTFVVLNCQGIGYHCKISLHTYDQLPENTVDGPIIRLYTYLQVREDGLTLFGFFGKEEQDLFELLISVSGIGGNIGLGILSGLRPAEVIEIIQSGDTVRLKKVRGVGEKMAARIILELQDKINARFGDTHVMQAQSPPMRLATHPLRPDAVAALTTLGLPKTHIEKKLDEILAADPDISLESLIRAALRS